MATPDNRDLLAAFNPYSEYFAISSGDGRIKIWDTLKGQLQTEFANITSPDATGGIQQKLAERGHLSLDYKCMQWVQLGKKKKKSRNLLLVLGTGGGDILALDVASGILKWKVSDCHPGGASSVSFSRHGSLYTGGVDGMVCKIDPSTGNLLGKFRASTKAISALSVSADGRTLATAASQLKIFSSADYKKIQKFSGHPVGVRCMIFTEDGKYVLTSGVGEKNVAIWKIDGRKNQTAVCVLSMEHPAVFLDSKGTCGSSEDSGFCILAVSEIGLCYFWCGKNAGELGSSKPTKICISVEHCLLKKQGNTSSAIYSAKFQDIFTPASALVLFAYGSIVKPSFEKLSLQAGTDINLTNTRDQLLLLPIGQTDTQKARAMQIDVTTLDRANAEDAMLPIPKLYDSHKKKRKDINTQPHEVLDHVMVEPASNVKNDTLCEVYEEKVEEDNVNICLEDRLKSAGILRYGDDINLDKFKIPTSFPLDTSLLKEPHILGGMTLTAKKIKSTILSMSSSDALKFLEMLMLMWKRRSISEKSIFPWISGILVNHGKFIASRESSVHMLASLKKMTMFKSTAAQSLLQLSGRLQLFLAQASHRTSDASHFDKVDETEIEDDDIDEVIYGEEADTSESDVESDAMDDQI